MLGVLIKHLLLLHNNNNNVFQQKMVALPVGTDSKYMH